MKRAFYVLEGDFKSHYWAITANILCYCQRKRVSLLIIDWFHFQCAHGQSGLSLNELRSSTYWETISNASLTKMVFKCVQSHRLYGKTTEQKMADLEAHRLSEASPFT